MTDGNNVEIVRSSYEALNRGDIDATLAALDPDVEWRESQVLPESGVYSGRDAVRRLLTDWLESWETFRQDVEEALVAGDRVLAFLHLSATGKGSGATVDARYAHLWTMRGGKAVRVDAYYDRDEALGALESGAGDARTSP